jgi:hypothetical protein
MKKILRVIKKIVVWLGYIILAVTAVVVVIIISEDDMDTQKVGTPVTPSEGKAVDEVLSFQTVASNPECESDEELFFMCSFIEKRPQSSSIVYICRKDKDVVLNIYRVMHNDLTSLESTMDSFVPWPQTSSTMWNSFEFNDQGTNLTVDWWVDRMSSEKELKASVNGEFNGFGDCDEIQTFPGIVFAEDLEQVLLGGYKK